MTGLSRTLNRLLLVLRRFSIIATLVPGVAPSTWAVDIPIVNAGFEQVVLPCAPGPNCFSSNNVSGWTASAAATFKPSTGPGGIFPGGIPDGVNVLGLGTANAAFGDGVAVQTLGATLQPNTTYTLVYFVGSRADAVFAGYNVELLAGSTTLAADSSLAPASGTFVMGRVVYSSSAAIRHCWDKHSESDLRATARDRLTLTRSRLTVLRPLCRLSRESFPSWHSVAAGTLRCTLRTRTPPQYRSPSALPATTAIR